MTIFKSFLTTFEARNIFWGSWGIVVNQRIKPNHHKQVKIADINDMQSGDSVLFAKLEISLLITYLLNIYSNLRLVVF